RARPGARRGRAPRRVGGREPKRPCGPAPGCPHRSRGRGFSSQCWTGTTKDMENTERLAPQSRMITAKERSVAEPQPKRSPTNEHKWTRIFLPLIRVHSCSFVGKECSTK